MSIFDRLLTRDMHRETRDTIRPTEMALTTDATGQIRDYTTDRNKEWVVELKLRQNYWANDVQRQGVEKIAIRVLAATLFEDVLRELPRLRLCIESGDKMGAVEAINRIEEATKP